MTILLPIPSTSRTRSSIPSLPPSHGFGELPLDIEAGLHRVGEVVRNARRVIVIAGAGISTPAIPDFRSSTGLFKTLRHTSAAEVGSGLSKRSDKGKASRGAKGKLTDGSLGLSSKMGAAGIRSGKDLFDIKCLSSPTLLPHHHALLTSLHRLSSATRPTPFHILLKTLDDQGRLLRVYTQNIDGLEGKAGLDCRVPELPVKKVVMRGKRKVIGEGKAVEGGEEPCSQTSAIAMEPETLLRSRSQSPRADIYSIEDLDPAMFAVGEAQDSFYPLIPTQTTMVSPPTSPDRHISDGSRPLAGYATWPRAYPGQSCSWEDDVDTSGLDILAQAIAATQPGMERRSNSPEGVSHSVTSASDITDRRAVDNEITDGGSTEDFEVELAVEEKPVAEPAGSAESTQPSTPGPTGGEQDEQPPIQNLLLPRCVPLHGLLHEMHCTLCSHSVPLALHLPLPDEIIPCPSCQSHQEERIEKSARPRSIGTLRAGVVLYGEEHRHGEAIGAVVEKDIRGNKDDGKVDLLIVAGTTLHIPGVKRMIKEFARVLKSKPLPKKGGQKGKRRATEGEEAPGEDDDEEDFPVRTIFLNMDPPGKGKGGEWADIFDVWVQGNLQDFVQEWVDKPRRSPRKKEKRQIVLSPSKPILMPSGGFSQLAGSSSSISVRKTGNLTMTLSVKHESKIPASPRKRKAVDAEPTIPQTPPKSSRGRPVKPSAKVLSAKKRQRAQPLAVASKTNYKSPCTPVKTPSNKSSTREPRNSMRRYVCEGSPCANLTERSSSPLSSAPPSSDAEDGEDGGNAPFRSIYSMQVEPASRSTHNPANANVVPPSIPPYHNSYASPEIQYPRITQTQHLLSFRGQDAEQAEPWIPSHGRHNRHSPIPSLTTLTTPGGTRSPYPASFVPQPAFKIVPPSGVISQNWEDPSWYMQQTGARERQQSMLNFPTMKCGTPASNKMTSR